MHRKPALGTLIAALLAAALVAAGCKKEDEKSKDEDGTEATSDDSSGDEPGKSAGTKDPGAESKQPPLKADLAVFPSDSDFVASLSIDSLRQSALWEKYSDQIMEDAGAGFAELEETCGIAPMQAFDSFTAGGKSEEEEEVVIVLSGMKREEIESCARTLADKEGQALEIKKEGELSHFKTDEGAYWVAWRDERTLVMSMNQDKAYVEARARGEDGLDGNEKFVDLLGQVNGAATFWFAAIPAEGTEMAQGFQQMGGQAEAIFASVDLDAGLDLDGGLRMATAADAESAAAMARQGLQMARQQLKPLAKYVDKVDIQGKDTDVIVQLELTEAELQELGKTVEQFVQGMGGMMGGGM